MVFLPFNSKLSITWPLQIVWPFKVSHASVTMRSYWMTMLRLLLLMLVPKQPWVMTSSPFRRPWKTQWWSKGSCKLFQISKDKLHDRRELPTTITCHGLSIGQGLALQPPTQDEDGSRTTLCFLAFLMALQMLDLDELLIKLSFACLCFFTGVSLAWPSDWPEASSPGSRQVIRPELWGILGILGHIGPGTVLLNHQWWQSLSLSSKGKARWTEGRPGFHWGNVRCRVQPLSRPRTQVKSSCHQMRSQLRSGYQQRYDVSNATTTHHALEIIICW